PPWFVDSHEAAAPVRPSHPRRQTGAHRRSRPRQCENQERELSRRSCCPFQMTSSQGRKVGWLEDCRLQLDNCVEFLVLCTNLGPVWVRGHARATLCTVIKAFICTNMDRLIGCSKLCGEKSDQIAKIFLLHRQSVVF